MSEPMRTYAGETGQKYRCFRCNKWSKFTREKDTRAIRVEQVEGGQLISDRDTPPDLDPPLLPTLYRCGRCGHEHSALPDR